MTLVQKAENLIEKAKLATPGHWYKDRDFPEVKVNHTTLIVLSAVNNHRCQEDTAYIAAANPETIQEICERLLKLEHEFEWLMIDSINFRARVRENWEFLNVNNYEANKNGAVWKAYSDLGKRLELACAALGKE